jgi:hypothetical protein
VDSIVTVFAEMENLQAAVRAIAAVAGLARRMSIIIIQTIILVITHDVRMVATGIIKDAPSDAGNPVMAPVHIAVITTAALMKLTVHVPQIAVGAE